MYNVYSEEKKKTPKKKIITALKMNIVSIPLGKDVCSQDPGLASLYHT